MKLRPVKKFSYEPQTQTQTQEQKKAKAPRKKQENKLPSDEYKPMLPPTRFLVRETYSSKDPSKVVKQYLELSVKRFGEDIENAPMVYVQMYQESEFYTGYLKGKTVYLPLEMIYDLIDSLSDLSEECDKLGIE